MEEYRVQGLFVCDKPTEISSAGFLNSMKRILKLTEPIGHGGTLDPFAQGLLIVGIGRQYTRSLEYYLKGADKTYEATIILGAGSDTYDRTGVISHGPGIQSFGKEQIKEAIKEIRSRTQQTPPPISAKKIHGVPAYTRARRGEVVELKPHPVTLREYEILDIEDIEGLTKLDIKLRVSSGFYIRSFAHDLGVLCGTDGYVEALTRVEIGFFKLSEALSLRNLQENVELVYRAKGSVQGVGFRTYAQARASTLNITGHARNTKEGIEIIGQGKVEALSAFLRQIKQGPQSAQIEKWQDYFRKCADKKDTFEIIGND